jgi:hypothetical protein
VIVAAESRKVYTNIIINKIILIIPSLAFRLFPVYNLLPIEIDP